MITVMGLDTGIIEPWLDEEMRLIENSSVPSASNTNFPAVKPRHKQDAQDALEKELEIVKSEE